MVQKIPNSMLEDLDPTLAGVVPIGALVSYGGSSAPSGWLLCFGQAVGRATYSDLFAAIGVTFGPGDGSSTFNVPDLRGRAVFGKDNMGGTPANRLTSGVSGVGASTLGAVGGDQRMQQHNHGVTDPGHNHTVTEVVAGPGSGVTTDGASSITGATGSSQTGVSVQSTGAGSSQNIPPAIVLNWIIRAE